MVNLLADAVVIIHFSFIVFALLGGLLALRWRRIAWVHLPTAVWAVLIEFFSWRCPLTPLENWLRAIAGDSGYEGGFIAHYLLPVIYPAGLSYSLQLVFGFVVLLVNVGVYWWVFAAAEHQGAGQDVAVGERASGVINVPNALSAFRIAIVPLLLWLAWNGYAGLFIVFLMLSLLTDALDGFFARHFHQTTALGARLDSWGDFTLYLSVPLCAWWLWPALIRQEAPFVAAIMVAYLLPVAIGFFKFRCLTSYHTWAAKLAAVLVAFGVLLLFAGGITGPLHIATVVFVLSALEELAITAVLAEPRSNVRSLWHVVRGLR